MTQGGDGQAIAEHGTLQDNQDVFLKKKSISFFENGEEALD